MRWVAAVLLVLGMVGAGCAGKAQTGSDAQTLEVPEARVDPSSGLGAIAGVVVDDAIRPIGGAVVEVRGAGQNATTSASGGFQFLDLKPGTYFLVATAKGYSSVQSSAVVAAGQRVTVRIQLPQDRSPQPYHTTYHFRGHIDFYASEVSFAAELLAPGTLQCTCAWNVTPDPGMRTLMFEAAGTTSVPNPGTPATKDGDAYWELIEDSGNGAIHSDYHDFPFSYRFENATFKLPDHAFLARITGGAWPSGQMDYDLYLTFFYNQEAPKDWSFLKGDT